MKLSDDAQEALVALCLSLLFIGLMAFLFAIAIQEEKAHRLCHERGGHMEPFNCGDVPVCPYPDAPCWMHTVCDWHCVGLPAEAP